jgi:hypothetical protein
LIENDSLMFLNPRFAVMIEYKSSQNSESVSQDI